MKLAEETINQLRRVSILVAKELFVNKERGHLQMMGKK